MTTYENLIAAGAENCHPVFIGVVNGKKEILARDIDGTVYLTDAGKEFLNGRQVEDKPKAKRASKKDAETVQSANALVGDDPDFDLSE